MRFSMQMARVSRRLRILWVEVQARGGAEMALCEILLRRADECMLEARGYEVMHGGFASDGEVSKAEYSRMRQSQEVIRAEAYGDAALLTAALANPSSECAPTYVGRGVSDRTLSPSSV